MEKRYNYQDAEIVYDVTGNGKPVLLVHGFGEDRTVWENQVAYLQSHYRLIVPDLPGSGGSAMISEMSMEGQAAMLVALLDHEDISACPVIGHSMGGYITLALVERHPGRATAFGLVHSSAFADSEEKKATRRKGIAFIRENGSYEFLKTATPNLFSPRSKEAIPAIIEKLIAAGNNFRPEALVSYYEAMMQRPDRTDVLRQSTVPVLFIMGKHDAAVPVEDTLKQCHLPGISYIHLLQDAGHMGMLEEPGNVNLFLDAFLRET